MKNIHILSTDEQIKNVGDVVKDQYGDIHIFTKNDGKEYGKTTTKLNIYITDDEEIKEGDWIFDIVTKKIEIAKFNHNDLKRDWKKIILTTDKDLIKDGVQSIPDEFLEWFIKNPSCEGVDVYNDKSVGYEYDHYSIIIPKEEPKKVLTEEDIWSKEDIDAVTDYINKETLSTKLHKGEVVDESYSKEFKQETLEEYIEREGYPEGPTQDIWEQGVREGVKWQAEQLYKDDVIQTLEKGLAVLLKRQERMYSEEEVLDILFTMSVVNPSNITKWFEQFKNK